MKINQAGLDLIKQYEGFSAEAYKCPAGKLTIGYGHVILPHESFGVIDKMIGEIYLKQDVEKAEGAVKRLVSASLNSNQFSALVSFVFNLGSGNFAESTMRLLINQGLFRKVPAEFGRWIHTNGEPLRGLIKRRADEACLFLEKE